jgi:hypothetical protein
MLQKKYDWEILKAGVLIGFRTVTVLELPLKKKDNIDNDNTQDENI